MKVFYIHGFNSGKNSSSAKNLKKYLKHNVIALTYSSSELFYNTKDSLIKQAHKHNNKEDLIFVGTSLGGLYANLIAGALNSSAILINPVSDPINNLKQFLGENKNFSTGELWTFTEEILSSYEEFYSERVYYQMPRVIILGKNDNILDYKYSLKKWKDFAKIVLTEDGHQLENYKILCDEIYKINGNISG